MWTKSIKSQKLFYKIKKNKYSEISRTKTDPDEKTRFDSNEEKKTCYGYASGPQDGSERDLKSEKIPASRFGFEEADIVILFYIFILWPSSKQYELKKKYHPVIFFGSSSFLFFFFVWSMKKIKCTKIHEFSKIYDFLDKLNDGIIALSFFPKTYSFIVKKKEKTPKNHYSEECWQFLIFWQWKEIRKCFDILFEKRT